MIEIVDEWNAVNLFRVIIKPVADSSVIWEQLYAQMMGWA